MPSEKVLPFEIEIPSQQICFLYACSAVFLWVWKGKLYYFIKGKIEKLKFIFLFMLIQHYDRFFSNYLKSYWSYYFINHCCESINYRLVEEFGFPQKFARTGSAKWNLLKRRSFSKSQCWFSEDSLVPAQQGSWHGGCTLPPSVALRWWMAPHLLLRNCCISTACHAPHSWTSQVGCRVAPSAWKAHLGWNALLCDVL